MQSPLTSRSLDDLESEIISLTTHLNAAEYKFLVLIREFDTRQGWRTYGLNNCSEWLNSHCGISLGTAREKLRVAYKLLELPLCSKAFEEGRLPYSKMRAMSRIVDPAQEEELLDLALDISTSRLEEYCRQVRYAQGRESTVDVNRLHRRRNFTCVQHDDGSVHISGCLTQEAGELLMKALQIAFEKNTSRDASDDEPESFVAKQADALVDIAEAYLAGGESKNSSDRYQVMVHVDETALHHEGGRSDLPIESMRRLCCDASVVPVVEDADGNVLSLGRKQRVVSPSLKRALLARDESCRFPGCTHDRWLDAHHVMHWADGGETSAGNMMLLCKRHHRMLHEGGYTIQKNFRGDWYFRTASGRVLSEGSHIDKDASRDASDDEIIEAMRDLAGAAHEVREPSVRYLANRAA